MISPQSLVEDEVVTKVLNHQLPPIIEDGTDLEELYQEGSYQVKADGEARWLDFEYELADVGTIFPLDGMRVLYHPIKKFETILGTAELSKEVFLTGNKEFVTFLTFRDTTFYINEDKYTKLHRVKTKNQSISDDESRTIKNNIISIMKNSQKSSIGTSN
jgi:hypothetical protein